MPQLDTIHITLTYMWTWSILYMTTQKIKTLTMTRPQKYQPTIKPVKTPPLPWL